VRAAASFQPELLDTLGLGASPVAIKAPDGRVFDRWPLSYIQPAHLTVLSLAERLGDAVPLSGGVAGWPAWFAAAWLEVRGLLKLREVVARGN
jgi:hypothetical protein